MIAAYASLDTVQRAMRFGAGDYLVKPFARGSSGSRGTGTRPASAAHAGPGARSPPDRQDAGSRAAAGSGAGRRTSPGLLRTMLQSSAGDGGRRRFLPGHGAGHGRSCRAARRGGDAVTTAWRTALYAVREPVAVSRARVAAAVAGRAGRSRLRGRGGGAGDRRGPAALWAHLVLYHHRAPGLGGADLAALRPVTDLIVTAVRTRPLSPPARQAAERVAPGRPGRSCGRSPPPCSSIPRWTGRSPRSPSSSSKAPATSASRFFLDADEPVEQNEPAGRSFPGGAGPAPRRARHRDRARARSERA